MNLRPAAIFGTTLALGFLTLIALTTSPNAMNFIDKTAQKRQDCVILLHGLARTARSMATLANTLEFQGYRVANISYPSRSKPIQELAPLALQQGLNLCTAEAYNQVHIVTHSMGGILVREYLRTRRITNLGRVVMLAPPNHGSEVVDVLGNVPGFRAINGPAGVQLGTGPNSVPRALGAADFEVGVIAGNRSINPLLSLALPGENDGKVSVDSTRLEGMTDFVTVPHSHSFIMQKQSVISLILQFLRQGRFAETT